MRKLTPTSLDWALQHLQRLADTDKFPVPFELDVIGRRWDSLREQLLGFDLTQHKWQGQRKVLVPKDQFSFRNAAQLDPVDALLFAALMHEVGPLIEARRSPAGAGHVFSYRFEPTDDGGLFAADQWDHFWRTSIEKSQVKPFVVVADITDFYNQISHHSVENQLQRCGVSKPDIRVIMNLLKSFTDTISKGVPVGPHPSHLLAESSLVPIDELLLQRGMDFCRYVDDIHIFCATAQDAQVALFALATALDQYHKLTLNRQKTRVLQASAFQPMALRKAEDQPINSTEESVLCVIRRHSRGPYTDIAVSELTADDLAQLSQRALEEVFSAYLNASEVDFIRLRFLVRRLAQVGVPGAVEFLVRNVEQLLPAFSEIARYLNSAKDQYQGSWATIGDSLLRLLDSPIAKESEYIQLVLLGLFGRIADLDHIAILTNRFGSAGSSAQREILLAATIAGADSWLRTLKSNFSRYDPWLRRAFLFATRTFPTDEREKWAKHIKSQCSPLELEILADASA